MKMVDWKRGRDEALAIAAGWASDGPGGAIVLFDRDGVRDHACGGLASIEHALPFTPDTTNRYASISKHILATLLLKADIPLDATLGSLLPDLPPAVAAVTLGRALDMTGAIPDMMELFWQRGIPYTATLSADEIFAALRRFPALNAEPGTEMSYSNTGWRIAQRVLEARLGISYAQAIDQIMGELGLPIRFPYDETEIVPGLATGYWRDGERWARGRYGMHMSGSGGVAGTAAGLAGWGSALLSGRGPLAGMLERLTAPRQFSNGETSNYRLGLNCSSVGRVALVGHGGSLPGYRNHLLMAPELGIGVVILTNREEEALWPAMRVMAALTGEALPRPAQLDAAAGLYVAHEGPFWAEVTTDAINFMGGFERLLDAGDGVLRSLPSTLDITLRQTAPNTFEGSIGGVARKLEKVPSDTRLDPKLVGRWRERVFATEIEIRADGTARMAWLGDTGLDCVLAPLPGGRALASHKHGPWLYRPCLHLQADGSLRLSGPRARILHFDRIA
jgi:CubicO group peptidase (beta-lactamase class C family)